MKGEGSWHVQRQNWRLAEERQAGSVDVDKGKKLTLQLLVGANLRRLDDNVSASTAAS